MQTTFEKIWNQHVVAERPGHPTVLYVDLHLLHEVTSPQAFSGLRRRGLGVRRPERTCATMDHSTPTDRRSLEQIDSSARHQLAELENNCKKLGITLYPPGHERHGIAHVIGPELGLTQPGMTIVCGDSHTATHGAFGAIAFGIGTSEVEHVLATQCLLQRRPKTLEVRIEGQLRAGVSAKDVILAVIARLGTGGGSQHAIEYAGSAIRALDMEGRMTICNMSIEAGARAGLIAPDDTTFQYLAGRPFAPSGAAFEAAIGRWRNLASDAGAQFDQRLTLDASEMSPMITFGTNPGQGIAIDAPVPLPEQVAVEERAAFERALRYMQLEPGKPLVGKPIDVVFIGSCTNSRLGDLRIAASILRGRKLAPGVRVLVVPGSKSVQRAAEAEGLDRIFTQAGAEWREPGCSMCIAMNGDQIGAGQYAVSTSNRNFEGRQGRGGRTFLASPLTAAAAAVTGKVTDARTLVAA
jgi:3-isopropylmalate/(R)-2-methylmalate dehydratase large subunit